MNVVGSGAAPLRAPRGISLRPLGMEDGVADLEARPVLVNGDSETSRSSCHMLNAVQANGLGGWRSWGAGAHAVYNVAAGEGTTLNELFQKIQTNPMAPGVSAVVTAARLVSREFRSGDVRHSLAYQTQTPAGFSLSRLEYSNLAARCRPNPPAGCLRYVT